MITLFLLGIFITLIVIAARNRQPYQPPGAAFVLILLVIVGLGLLKGYSYVN